MLIYNHKREQMFGAKPTNMKERILQMMIKKQNFGVEIELTGITRRNAALAVAGVLGTIPTSDRGGCYHTREIPDAAGRRWKVMRDSSIRPERNDDSNANPDEYRVELVTPILKYEDIETLQKIIRAIRQAGGKVNSSCGIHIHVDGANHTPQSLRNLMEFMVARQYLVNECLNNSTRASHWCRPISAQLLKAVKKEKDLTRDSLERIWYSRQNDNYSGGINHTHYNDTRYHGLNLHAFFSKGTVEFRLFNSTLHAGKVKAYIQFCLALSAWAIEAENKVVFRSMDGYTPEQKVTIMINVIRNRLGLVGKEFETCRLHMLTVLKKNAGMAARRAA